MANAPYTMLTIGPWEFRERDVKGGTKVAVEVYAGEEHLATLDNYWEADADRKELHRAAGHWALSEISDALEAARRAVAS